MTVNQRANGGTWVSLGTFTLDPASAQVVLSGGGGTGSLSADAMRFVASGGAPPDNVYYVHTDHLGTPRLMTDASAAIVWDRQSYPFGATYSTAGLGDSNVRFPGQYFDAESGLHYNYFRDYDPATGRYIQSDPIRLNGGLNTYAYVSGSPLNIIDLFGLEGIIEAPVFPRPPLNYRPWWSPRYGCWGGLNWSGCVYTPHNNGKNGTALPIDSLDECLKGHDLCWGECDGNEACKRKCDYEFVERLKDLDDDPRNWKNPPISGTETKASVFKEDSKFSFGGSGPRRYGPDDPRKPKSN